MRVLVAAIIVSGDLADSRIALEHVLFDTRPFARPPEFCDVRDSITQRPAIVGGTALDRPWDAYELCSHFICSEAHLGIAVTA